MINASAVLKESREAVKTYEFLVTGNARKNLESYNQYLLGKINFYIKRGYGISAIFYGKFVENALDGSGVLHINNELGYFTVINNGEELVMTDYSQFFSKMADERRVKAKFVRREIAEKTLSVEEKPLIA